MCCVATTNPLVKQGYEVLCCDTTGVQRWCHWIQWHKRCHAAGHHRHHHCMQHTREGGCVTVTAIIITHRLLFLSRTMHAPLCFALVQHLHCAALSEVRLQRRLQLRHQLHLLEALFAHPPPRSSPSSPARCRQQAQCTFAWPLPLACPPMMSMHPCFHRRAQPT